jgi:NTP pyrophosphatase (non-canonical NTP hydrolase)
MNRQGVDIDTPAASEEKREAVVMEEEASNGRELTFGDLRRANLKRLPQFRNAHGAPAHEKPDGSDWDRAAWLEALVGEVGEYANISKKFRRGDITYTEFFQKAKSELADIQTYLDLLAFSLQIDLASATVAKFNEVSERVSSDVFISAELGAHFRVKG